MKIQSEVKVDDVTRGNQKQTSRLGYADPVQVELWELPYGGLHSDGHPVDEG